jgi:chromosome segregation ATPase
MGERDIHQKKRVSIGVQKEIEQILSEINQEDIKIKDKKQLIEQLQNELAEALQELEEFKNDNMTKDEELQELET